MRITSFPKEAKITQKDTLFTFFSQSSGFHSSISNTSVPHLFSGHFLFFYILSPSSHLDPLSLPNQILTVTPALFKHLMKVVEGVA